MERYIAPPHIKSPINFSLESWNEICTVFKARSVSLNVFNNQGRIFIDFISLGKDRYFYRYKNEKKQIDNEQLLLHGFKRLTEILNDAYEIDIDGIVNSQSTPYTVCIDFNITAKEKTKMLVKVA